jgi:hypothetical protein
MKSRTDSEDPKRAIPYTAMQDPKREKDRSDIDAPKWM